MIDPQARAFLASGVSYYRLARLEEAQVAGEAARDRSRTQGDADAFFDATLLLAKTYDHRYDNERSVALIEQALSGDWDASDPRIIRIAAFGSQALTIVGRPADAVGLLDRVGKRIRSFAPRDLPLLLAARGYAEVRLGSIPAALNDYALAATFEATDMARQNYHHNASVALGEAGMLPEALLQSERAFAAYPTAADSWVGHMDCSRAWYLLQSGRLAEARFHLERSLQVEKPYPISLGRRTAVAATLGRLMRDTQLEELGESVINWVATAGSEGHRIGPIAVASHNYYVGRGLLDEARSLRDRVLRRLRNAFGAWWFLYEVVVHGGDDEQEQAIRLLSETNDSHPMARGFRCMASSIESRRAGRVRESIALGREAEGIFSGSGMALHAATAMRLSGRRRQADELLRQCQVRIRGSELGRHDPVKGDARLTNRQNEVAQLASAGLANAQIAENLGISLSTVEQHLAAVRARLNVGSRTEFRTALMLR